MYDQEQDPPHVQGQPRSSVEILIDHAHRMWESERENAGRIAQRTQLVAGGIVALIGLGLFGFNWLYEVPSRPMLPWWLAGGMHLFLLGTLFCFMQALAILFQSGGRDGTATELLEIAGGDVGRPIRRLVLSKVNAAYYDLKERNAEKWLRLKRAQEWFSYGVVLVFLTLLCYLGGSLPAKMSPEGSSYGRDDHGSPATQTVEVRSAEEARSTLAGNRPADPREPGPGEGHSGAATAPDGEGSP